MKLKEFILGRRGRFLSNYTKLLTACVTFPQFLLNVDRSLLKKLINRGKRLKSQQPAYYLVCEVWKVYLVCEVISRWVGVENSVLAEYKIQTPTKYSKKRRDGGRGCEFGQRDQFFQSTHLIS